MTCTTHPAAAPATQSAVAEAAASTERMLDELHRLAARRLAGERRGHTLQATALANEAWLSMHHRLGEVAEDPQAFSRLARATMRRVLIDHARRRDAQRRGGGLARVPLEDLQLVDPVQPEEALVVDDALEQLERRCPRAADVVRLRVLTGLDEGEVAAALGTSVRTVRRSWAFARAWLQRALAAERRPQD